VAPQADRLRNRLRITGVGTRLAGDDAAGICVANKLRKLPLSGVDVCIGGQAPLDILDYLDGARSAIIIDAVKSGKEPGTIVRFGCPRDLAQLTSLTWMSGTPSTHLFGLGEALSLGRELKIIPSHIILYGIEFGDVKMGEPISSKISDSIDTVVNRIVEDIKRPSCRTCQ
jgi:hydrogenase maturation protease